MASLVRNLLAERNLACLQQKIKQVFPKLFRFKYTGLLFAEKSLRPFSPNDNQLYSIIMNEDHIINADFRLKEDNIIMHSARVGITGLAIDK